ncbi:UvrD-helicase domain-containing protein [Paraburkholderia hospita]|uniref:UvrD-helicase domain-containing protein n=1 Tax=Paraburkholderia hospita TaxID=169430 RepID=UPI0008A78009|nr:UvrD-helicase domain-containing protein [Paraburkholderia hospita]SEI14467.1 Superfamily I DNA or RNA helicase [Paraburkholderia hospita]
MSIETAVQPTPEQAKVIGTKARRVGVNAYAGTGKTSTAVQYAQARPQENFLYMAYNASIAREAKTKFPAWVECRTMHSLAFGAVVPRLFGELGKPDPARGVAGWGAKLGDMRPMAIAKAMQINPRMARLIKSTLEAWFCSADRTVTDSNIPGDLKVPPSQRAIVVQGAKDLFAKMCDPKSMEVTLPHDGYLKLWQLTSPDLSRKYTSIICDEAQDLNPTVLDILKNQKTGLLVIGDENQAIYQFRGATNAMREIPVDERHFLTTSFRFGSGVAAVATALLGTFRKIPRPITGLGKHRTTQFDIDQSQTFCTISRTNAALFDAAVSNLDSGKPYHFVGGTEKYRFDMMMDAFYLMTGEHHLIKDAAIKQFTTLADLKNAAEDTDDRELKFLAKIAETYGERIPELIEELKSRHDSAATPKSLKGGIVFTTAHSSKGLEFEQVVLTEDYFELTDDKEILLPADKVPEEELNLLYVAATRAERALQLNESIRSLLRAVQRMSDANKTARSATHSQQQSDAGTGKQTSLSARH